MNWTPPPDHLTQDQIDMMMMMLGFLKHAPGPRNNVPEDEKIVSEADAQALQNHFDLPSNRD